MHATRRARGQVVRLDAAQTHPLMRLRDEERKRRLGRAVVRADAGREQPARLRAAGRASAERRRAVSAVSPTRAPGRQPPRAKREALPRVRVPPCSSSDAGSGRSNAVLGRAQREHGQRRRAMREPAAARSALSDGRGIVVAPGRAGGTSKWMPSGVGARAASRSSEGVLDGPTSSRCTEPRRVESKMRFERTADGADVFDAPAPIDLSPKFEIPVQRCEPAGQEHRKARTLLAGLGEVRVVARR
jgi:hypothetical protein